jgi:hypothetical protein
MGIMDIKLIQDTLSRVEKLIDPRTQICLVTDEQRLAKLASMVSKAPLPRKRKITVLGGYLLLDLGLTFHKELDRETGEERTRSLLGGDYLFGAYLRWLVQNAEHELLAFLVPIHKNIQIRLAAGGRLEQAFDDLFDGFSRFLLRCETETQPKQGGRNEA